MSPSVEKLAVRRGRGRWAKRERAARRDVVRMRLIIAIQMFNTSFAAADFACFDFDAVLCVCFTSLVNGAMFEIFKSLIGGG